MIPAEDVESRKSSSIDACTVPADAAAKTIWDERASEQKDGDDMEIRESSWRSHLIKMKKASKNMRWDHSWRMLLVFQ